MINAAHMGTSGWSLKLVDDAPARIRDEFRHPEGDDDWRSFVCFLANDNASAEGAISTTVKRTLDEQWLWVGPVWQRANKMRQFAGPGLAGFLENDRGSHPNSGSTTNPTFPATITQIVQSWFSAFGTRNGIRYGTAYSATSTTVDELEDGTFLPPLKPVLDTLMAQTGNEYWIRPPGLLDWGIATSLFRSSPNVLIMEEAPGSTLGLRLLKVPLDGIQADEDVYGYTNASKVRSSDYIWGTGTGFLGGDAATAGPTLAQWYSGGAPTFAPPTITIDSTDTNDVDQVADIVANQHAAADRSITVTCTDEAPVLATAGTGAVGINPGDWVHVYSPEDGIVDEGNQVSLGATFIHPESIRAVQVDQPFLRGMGAYVCRYLGSNEWKLTRITDFVDYDAEPAETTITLGTKPRPTVPARYASYIQ